MSDTPPNGVRTGLSRGSTSLIEDIEDEGEGFEEELEGEGDADGEREDVGDSGVEEEGTEAQDAGTGKQDAVIKKKRKRRKKYVHD